MVKNGDNKKPVKSKTFDHGEYIDLKVFERKRRNDLVQFLSG